MSIQAVGWVLDQNGLPPSAKLVLVAIANHADHTDGYCWLRAETIGRESSCTTRNVHRIVAALVRNGYLRKAPRKGGDGKQRANDYWILFDRPAAEWSWFKADERDQTDEDETQDVVVADLPQDTTLQDEGTEGFVESSGPSDTTSPNRVTPGIRHIDKPSFEPSKTKEIKKEIDGGLKEARPRTYRPPPQQVVGDETSKESSKQVFVVKGTPAWQAWCKWRGRQGKVPSWPVIIGRGEHAGKSGWFFPKLFPPSATGPPETLMTEQDEADSEQLKVV